MSLIFAWKQRRIEVWVAKRPLFNISFWKESGDHRFGIYFERTI